MKWMYGVVCMALLVGLLVPSPARATIIVSLDIDLPFVDPCYEVGLYETFNVDVYADIPEADATVGWGLDMWYDEDVVSFFDIVYGADWSGIYAQDPDPDDPTVALNFAAITVWPDPDDAVWGYTKLVTITLTADALGTTTLCLGDHNPPDENEGFALDSPPGGFADVNYPDPCPCVTVIPEPGTLAALALGSLALLRRR